MWKLGLRAEQFLFWEYINGIFLAVHVITQYIYLSVTFARILYIRVRVEGPIHPTPVPDVFKNLEGR